LLETKIYTKYSVYGIEVIPREGVPCAVKGGAEGHFTSTGSHIGPRSAPK
jgi:hypothetical protein